MPSLTVPLSLRTVVEGGQREQSQVSSGVKIRGDVSYKCRDMSLYPHSLFPLQKGGRTASSHPTPAFKPEVPV